MDNRFDPMLFFPKKLRVHRMLSRDVLLLDRRIDQLNETRTFQSQVERGLVERGLGIGGSQAQAILGIVALNDWLSRETPRGGISSRGILLHPLQERNVGRLDRRVQ